MKRWTLLNSTTLKSALFVGLATGVQASGQAQTGSVAEEVRPAAAKTADDDQADGTDNGSIIVTGTRIARPNLSSAAPITSLTAEELTNTGRVTLGDIVAELPAFKPSFTQSNSQTRANGFAGLNLLDLRGLSYQRTLVLVNGRRHVTSFPGSSSVDANTIPMDLLDRVDVVTGGNSSVYGSDAIAGVVNFILKRDFDGIRARGQAGISDEGDRATYYGSLTAGHNFSDDRGNVAVSLEYAKSEPLLFKDRNEITGAYSGRTRFQPTDPALSLGTDPPTGNGVIDRTLLSGIRQAIDSEGGSFVPSCPAATPANAAQVAANCTGLVDPRGRALGRVYIFDPAGNLIPSNCVTDFRTIGFNQCIGGLGSTIRTAGTLQPGYERKVANLLASYEITPAFRPFLEAKYVELRVESENPIPDASQRIQLSINNPFLTDQARIQLRTSLGPTATTFNISRLNADFATRHEIDNRKTYRIVAGVEGTFNDDWHYEVSLNYGRFDSSLVLTGNYILSLFNNAMNAVRDKQGNIVCAINNDANTANDDPACVPLNLFGNGASSAAARNYIAHTTTRDQWAEQYDALAFLSGSLSQFELPGGPIKFALGAEYRREDSQSAFDPITRSGAARIGGSAFIDPPALEVKEAFGEVRLPILAAMPFANELSVEAAARVSDYSFGQVGTIFAYNIGAIYSPVQDIRLRASYARSVRAPTQNDLFSAALPYDFSPLVDPCSIEAINNNPNRVRNCAAAGLPVGFVNVSDPRTGGIQALDAPNPDLRAEKSDSFTLGAVLQPRLIPDLSLSVDYYNITIANAITGITAGETLNRCYDNPSGIDNVYCSGIKRNPDGTLLGQLDKNGLPLKTAAADRLINRPQNVAKFNTSGIDFDLAYRSTMAEGVTLNLHAIASYIIKRNFYTDRGNLDFADTDKGELGNPEWSGLLSADIDFGAFDFGWRMRFIDRQVTADGYEVQHSFQGRPPTDPDAYPIVWYPRTFYHSVEAGFEVNDRFRFYAGVDNVFDTVPPYGLTGTGLNDPYDNVGRFFYAGAKVKFR